MYLPGIYLKNLTES